MPTNNLNTGSSATMLERISALESALLDDEDVMMTVPGIATQGTVYHVKPASGSDSNDGLSADNAFKTLAKALATAAANKNDIVLLYAESNTASGTTDYQDATLDWNKDMVHLIGVNSGVNISPRSRIALRSTYDTAANLFTLSANGCLIMGIEFFAGVAGTNPTGCVNVTGSRNRFQGCHIAGIGNDANDIADAYSLRVAGSENMFKSCTIGLDTVSRGTADNAEIVLAGGARNKFIDCDIVTFASANSHQFLKRAASGSDRFTLFRNCVFINAVQSTGVSMLEALDVTAGGSPGGMIVLHGCGLIGAAEWEANSGASGASYATMGAADAANGGVGLAITGA